LVISASGLCHQRFFGFVSMGAWFYIRHLW